MHWFKHLVDSGDDPDIGYLMERFGPRGYYMFFRTLELMAREFDPENPGTITVPFRWLSQRYSGKIADKLLTDFFLETSKLGRIMSRHEGRTITLNCPKLKGLADEYTNKLLKKMSGQTPDRCRDNVRYKNKNKNENENIKKVLPRSSRKTPSKTYDDMLPIWKENGKMYFDIHRREFINISDDDLMGWSDAFPILDVEQELKVMASWLMSNIRKAKSLRDWPRFINGWLTRNAGKYQRGDFKPGKPSAMEQTRELIRKQKELERK